MPTQDENFGPRNEKQYVFYVEQIEGKSDIPPTDTANGMYIESEYV